ncbi:MAG: hypothetical protein ABEJ26_09235 [Halosimplex sp.]
MTKGPSGPIDDERGGVERWVIWLVVLAITVAVVGSVLYFGDELRRDSPGAEFSVSFDAEAGALTVEHAGGDSIVDRTTRSLSVVVLDRSTGNSEEVVWVSDPGGPVKRGGAYPVREGDTLTVDDPSVDSNGDGSYLDAERSVGFYLESGDSVRVVWTGSMRGEVRSVTLANATLG